MVNNLKLNLNKTRSVLLKSKSVKNYILKNVDLNVKIGKTLIKIQIVINIWEYFWIEILIIQNI